MHSYVVIASKSGRQIDPLLVSRAAKPDLPNLAFVPDEFLHWTNANASIHFLGWQAFTELNDIGSHWQSDASRLTAFAGYVWPRESGWDWGRASWAAQLAEYFDAHDPRSSNEDLFGIYSAVTIPNDGAGWIVTDLVSSGVVYVADAGDCLVLSSRAALCATAISPVNEVPERDVTGAVWFPFGSYTQSDDTGFAGVKTIPFGSHVRLDPMRGVQIVKPERHYWESDELAALPNGFEALGERLERELRATVRAIASFPAPVRQMRLSGGRDSRLLAALIMLEGVQDSFQFMSFGLRQTPDVIVAKSLAKAFGLPWVFEDRSDAQEWDIQEPLRIHVFQVSGSQSGWDHKGHLRMSPDVSLSGNYSEFFRMGPNSASTLHSPTIEQARIDLFRARRRDEMRLMRPEALHYYAGRFTDWIDSLVQDGVDYQRLGSMVIPHFNMRRLYGSGSEINSRIWMFPLYTPAAVRVVQHLPAARRWTERFHFDIIRKCSEDLATHPFVTKPWSPETYAHLPDSAAYANMESVTHQGPGSTHWRVAHFDKHRPFFRDILLDPSNPVYEVLDFERVKRFLDSDRLDSGMLRHLYGCLSAAIWLGGHELPARMNRTGELNIARAPDPGGGSIVTTGRASREIARRRRSPPPLMLQTRPRAASLPAGQEPDIAKSVVLVASAFPLASETFVADMLLHLLARGWDVNVAAIRSSRQDWESFPEIASQPLLTSRIHASAALPDVLEAQKPAVVHFQFGDLARQHLEMCKRKGIATVVSFRGYDACFQGLDDPRYYDEVWRHATAIHAVSDDIWTKAIERGCPPDTMHRVIHGSVDHEFFDPGHRDQTGVAGEAERPLRVLSVGRLVWKKGHEFSLRAVHQLIEGGVHTELTVIGYGSHREALMFEASDLGIQDHVQFLGATDRNGVRERMAESDVFLLSSLSEGFGIAVAEAQSMKLPVVCTDAEGLAENVLDQVTGFIVPRRDVQETAAKLRLLAGDPALRARMGEAGRARVIERFRVDQELDAIEALYRDALNRPARAQDRYASLRENGSPPAEPDIFSYLRLEEAFNEQIQTLSQ